MKSNYVVAEKSFEFAIRVVNLYKYLTKEQKEFVLSKQVLRSGTSIGANIEEAIGGLSKADFIARLGIAYKESRETIYWIRLLKATDYLNEKIALSMLKDADELLRIIGSIIRTSKTN